MQYGPDLRKLEEQLPGVTIGPLLGEGGYKMALMAIINGIEEALKVVHIPHDPEDESVQDENIRRLMREVRILGSCESPFLVKLGSLSPKKLEIEGEILVVYSEEVLSGDSLRDRIRAGNRPDISELATTACCCLDAIEELWNVNVVHRDIKPDNLIRLGFIERPCVMLDLGVAFVVGGTPLTRDPRMLQGTRYYLAPEMLEPDFRSNLDYRADMYALALTLYEYASGTNPFMLKQDAVYSTLQRIHSNTPQSLSELRPDLPSAFCRVVDQLLRKRPALRPNISIVRKIREANL